MFDEKSLLRTSCSYSYATTARNTVKKIDFIKMIGRVKNMAFHGEISTATKQQVPSRRPTIILNRVIYVYVNYLKSSDSQPKECSAQKSTDTEKRNMITQSCIDLFAVWTRAQRKERNLYDCEALWSGKLVIRKRLKMAKRRYLVIASNKRKSLS